MNHKPITGASTGTFTLEGLPPEPPQTYLGMARSFASGAQVLAANDSSNGISLAFLSAQAAECALKAYLSRDGDDAWLRNDHQIRHDLVALWELAIDAGLTVAATPPDWLGMLGHLHRQPYRLRYGRDVHGLVIPAADLMVTELLALVVQVEHQLR